MTTQTKTVKGTRRWMWLLALPVAGVLAVPALRASAEPWGGPDATEMERARQDPRYWLQQLAIGYGLTGVSYVVGLAASSVLDLPSSPVIVWASFGLNELSGKMLGTCSRRTRSARFERSRAEGWACVV